jgi:hypothetical protein
MVELKADGKELGDELREGCVEGLGCLRSSEGVLTSSQE